MPIKAALRRQIADRVAELAVDRFVAFFDVGDVDNIHPEEWLELQHQLEDELYRELASVKG